MSPHVTVLDVGPAVTVQDWGRPGLIAQGLSRGGAADPLALEEAAALLGAPHLALELAGFGGRFVVSHPQRIALTGAPMRVLRDGVPLAWHAVHHLRPDEVLEIGAVTEGVYGYLTFGGGLRADIILGGASHHLVAGIGAPLKAGAVLLLGEDVSGPVGLGLALRPPLANRFNGGDIHVLASAQTDLFSSVTQAHFAKTAFRRGARANRQGVSLDGGRFAIEGGLSLVSETIAPGDIQIAGDGMPYVLLCECQTTGGYPRLATVIPSDLARVAQCPAGAVLRFHWISEADALERLRAHNAERAALPRRMQPMVRDPDGAVLMAQSLISGVITGQDEWAE
ncbi:MAG: urea amidolyase [Marinovum sp.]|nr:urea amidolyase [Marinovum sp.]